MLVMGAGMGLVMAPLTTAVLNSVPSDKGGVASAINGAVRETGFAFGVALLGTIISQTYRDDFLTDGQVQGARQADQTGALGGLFDAISEKVGLAGKIVQSNEYFPGVPQEVRDLVQRASSEAFVNGMHLSFFITGLALIGTAVVSYVLINDRVAMQERVDEEGNPLPAVAAH
jgi:hypothetical protein